MKVRFWGTRGSIAAPGYATAKYGGNTSCVEVRSEDGTVLILDCGTGVRALGLHLLQTMPTPLRVHLLIGHTHWDHIQGFPFFTPAFLPHIEMNIYAPVGFQHGLADAMAGQMEHPYFPVNLRDLRSRMHFNELEEEFFHIGDMLVETQYLNHTAHTVAYRISNRGATVAYVTDHEPFWTPSDRGFHHPGDQRHIAFLKGVDLLIHDAQYTNEEYLSKVGWGHSTIEYATDIALAAGASRLALFHHDPTHDDATMERLESLARARVEERRLSLDVFAASEGLEVAVQGDGASSRSAGASAIRRRTISGKRILVVSANEGQVALVRQMLVEDGLVVLFAPDQRVALERARETAPDLAIIDGTLPDGEGVSLVEPLRACHGLATLPILLFTTGPETHDALLGPGSAVTDFLAKPFSPPMLHARVRAWLDRAWSERDDAAGRVAQEETSTGASAPCPAQPEGSVGENGIAALLGSLRLFEPLGREQVSRLAAQAVARTYPAGHVVIRQDEPAEHVYVVLSGLVRVVQSVPNTPLADRFLGELGRGEIFGEMGILVDERRSATVVAVERTRCVVVPKNDFMEVLRGSADLALSLLRVLAGRLYSADLILARFAPDALTGLNSRRVFLDQYRRVAVGARHHRSVVAVMLFDVLHLKTINDRFGYDIGDEVLRTVADALVGAARAADLVARYGGDEFAVLLVDAEPHERDRLVHRVQEKVEELVARRGLPSETTCLVGMAVTHDPPETV